MKKVVSACAGSNGSKEAGLADGRADGCAIFWNMTRLSLAEDAKRIPFPRFITGKNVAGLLKTAGKVKYPKSTAKELNNLVKKALEEYWCGECKGTGKDGKDKCGMCEGTGNKEDSNLDNVVDPGTNDKFLESKNVVWTDINDNKRDTKMYFKDMTKYVVDQNKKLDKPLTKIESKQVAMRLTLTLKKEGGVTESEHNIVVFTGHFKSGESADDVCVKPMQIQALTDAIKKVPNTDNIIVAADFNTKKGTPAFSHFANHNRNLHSAYDIEKLDREKRYTSGKWRRGGNQPDKCKIIHQTIDFIFTKGFDKVRNLSVPEWKRVKEVSPLMLPCFAYPSDHFMIGADLVLTKPEPKNN